MIVIVWLGCLVYTMLRPVSSGHVLYPTLVVLVVTSIILRRSVARWLQTCIFLVLLAIFLMVAVGATNANVGLKQQTIQWVGSVIVWTTWALSIRIGQVRRLLTVICVTTGVLSVLIIMYVGSQQGWLPTLVPNSLLLGQGAGFLQTQGGSTIRLYGLSTLTAAGPLALAMAIAPSHPLLPPRRIALVVAPLAFTASALAGRRAILVAIVVIPVVVATIGMLVRRRQRNIRVPMWVPLSLPLAFFAVAELARSAFGRRAWQALTDASSLAVGKTGSSTKGLDDATRLQEAHELLQGWAGHDLVGSGLGAPLVDGYYRNHDNPWEFELQYHLLLFDGGIVGATLVCFAGVFFFANAIRFVRNVPHYFPVVQVVMTGGISLFVANATDPYLEAVGHGWGVALMAGVVNACYMASRDDEALPQPDEVEAPVGSELNSHLV